MMQKNISLLPFNTFQVDVRAANFTEITQLIDLRDLIPLGKEQFFYLGGGANVLFVKDFPGLVIKNNLKGITRISDNEEEQILRVCSGEDWTLFVESVVEQGLHGVENLAFIPGTIGAAVVQNIAAYGQNFEDVFEAVEGIDLATGESFRFRKDECQFSYRSSIFKNNEYKSFFITTVFIRLKKSAQGVVTYRSRYESLADELVGKNPPYTVKDIYEAVVGLRMRKLPDWRKIGTAGSFFRNPIVTRDQYTKLAKEVSELQCYPVSRLEYGREEEMLSDEYVKIPAGRLLDELGWKGKKIGRVGTFERQALVVVNLGGASGEEILDFTHQMAEDVKRHYAIELDPEVCIVS